MQQRACGARAFGFEGKPVARFGLIAATGIVFSLLLVDMADAAPRRTPMWSCVKPVRIASAFNEQLASTALVRLAGILPGSWQHGQAARERPRVRLRYAAAAPLPPVIGHTIQRHGDPLPTIDPRTGPVEESGAAGDAGTIELAADAPIVHPNQPSPEERARPETPAPSPATETPAAEEPAPAAEAPPAEQPPAEQQPVAQPTPETPPAETAPASPPAAEAPPAEPTPPAAEAPPVAEPAAPPAAEAPPAEPAPPAAEAPPPAEPAPQVLPRLSSPPFEAPLQDDRDAINQCKNEQAAAGRSADVCIGKVANSCAENANGDAAATNLCVERETRVWAEKLDQSLGLLQGRLNEERATELSQVQESWVDFRQRNCAFYSSFYDGPLALPQAGFCIMRETAQRSIEVESLLTQAEQR